MLSSPHLEELHRAFEALRAVIEIRLQQARSPAGASGLSARALSAGGDEGLPPIEVFRGDGPFGQVVAACRLQVPEALILAAALAEEVDEGFVTAYQKLTPRPGSVGLTGEVARTLCANSFEGRAHVSTLLGPGAPLRRASLVEIEPSPHGTLAGRLRVEDDLLAWVLGRAPVAQTPSSDFPAAPLDTVHSLEDVIVSGRVARKLRELVARIQLQERVVRDWGFAHRHDNVQGLLALFHGPPGTGKTMAAAALAKTLGMPAFRVDLSALVSKYIGETEKHLARVFDRAARQRCILLFDEADAVFGQRTEVSDSHDRYANQEVSYLLSRVESHPGVVLLTTNLLANIDDAFQRRIQLVVEFPEPGVGERIRLWESVVPPELPLAPELDFQSLAEQFSLTGAQIRDATLDAAYRAAGDGQVVTEPHLMAGIRRQYEKAGRSFPARA